MINTINVPSRAAVVSGAIERQITNQVLLPGERLGTKADLRAKHRVSPGTLNEALRLLETRGLIQMKPGPAGGVFVAEQSHRLLLAHVTLDLGDDDETREHALTVRNALEPAIWAEFMHCYESKQSRLDDEIQQILDEMRAAEDAATYMSLNWRFHRQVAEVSSNPLLRTVYISMLDLFRSAVVDVVGLSSFEDIHVKDVALHKKLYDAARLGDKSGLDDALKRHAKHSQPRFTHKSINEHASERS